MDERLLNAFIMYYSKPSELIDELDLTYEEVLELLYEKYKEDIYRLINDKFVGDFDKNINDIDVEDLNWR